MRQIRVIGSCVLAASLLVVGCDNQPVGSTEDGLKSNYSGRMQVFSDEDLFRGVLFGVGPVAKQLPEIWGNTTLLSQLAVELATRGDAPAQKTQHKAEIESRLSVAFQPGWEGRAQEVSDAIQKRIQEVDPTFMTRFGDSLRSGDQIKIQSALASVGDFLRKDGVEPSNLKFANVSQSVANTWYKYNDIFYDNAIAVSHAAVLVSIALVIFPESGYGATLQHEMYIDLLARRLRSSPRHK
jgi:hypothetical protein